MKSAITCRSSLRSRGAKHGVTKGLGAKLLIGIRKMVDVLPSGFNPPDYLIFAHGKVCLISALISSDVLH